MSTRQSQSASAVSVTPAHEDTYRVKQNLYGDQLMPSNLIISVPLMSTLCCAVITNGKCFNIWCVRSLMSCTGLTLYWTLFWYSQLHSCLFHGSKSEPAYIQQQCLCYDSRPKFTVQVFQIGRSYIHTAPQLWWLSLLDRYYEQVGLLNDNLKQSHWP
jgi:hypothetical protein